MRKQFAVALVAAWASIASATAQVYPSRPITMVVPFAAGGSFDVLGRILAVPMTQALGQQVIIENTTGASGIIGTSRVANASPDGHMLLFGTSGTHAYNPTSTRSRDTTPLPISRRWAFLPSNRWCCSRGRIFPRPILPSSSLT